MRAIEQYRNAGLQQPISVRPGLAFHALLWGGGGFLLWACIWAVTEGDRTEQALGTLGLVLFGAGVVVMMFALVKSGRRGLLELSLNGVYLSYLGVTLPWADIGPAWVMTVRHRGGAHKTVLFLLRNARTHTDGMTAIGRLFAGIGRTFGGDRSGDAGDWGAKAVLFGPDTSAEAKGRVLAELERMRNAAGSDPDTIVIGVAPQFRAGISAADLSAVLNRELALNRGWLRPQADGREPVSRTASTPP